MSAIVIERIINAPRQKVWKAITDNSEMKQWYFPLDEFKPEVGFRFQFSGGTETQQYLHLCEVKEVIPQSKLSYSWKYGGYEGDSLVTFELSDEGSATKVVLTHVGVETFKTNDPNFGRDSFVAGWTDIIGKQLKNHVENKM
jgi:uncharacterized protein YndB with AHSA1/START domain